MLEYIPNLSMNTARGNVIKCVPEKHAIIFTTGAYISGAFFKTSKLVYYSKTPL